MRKSVWLTTVAMAAVAIYVVATGAPGGGPPSLVGKEAPEVALNTLDGKSVKLSAEKGNVVVMDFWATWCPPCRKSLPHVQEISSNKALAAKGLKVWAVNARETAAKVKAFVDENKYTFTVPMDSDGASMQAYLVRGIPTTIVVGRDGTVKAAFVGFGEGSAANLDAAIEKALAEPAK